MPSPIEIVLTKLRRHSQLAQADIVEIRKLPCHFRDLASGEDFIRQGDRPDFSAIVVSGTVARYHSLVDGGRQYLSFHIAGDWPDAQGLFLDRMDHSVCAVGPASLCAIPHTDLIRVFKERSNVGFSIWRETLIDASIFRQTITNIGSRQGIARLAHFFAEFYYRADAVGLVEGKSCALPLSQTQLGEALGMSLVTANRTLQSLRKSKVVDLRGGRLEVKSWSGLASIGGFNPEYLHLKYGKVR